MRKRLTAENAECAEVHNVSFAISACFGALGGEFCFYSLTSNFVAMPSRI